MRYNITITRTIRQECSATVEAESIDEILRRLEDGDIQTTVTDEALLSEMPARIIAAE